MPSIDALLGFVVAALVVLLTPGPAVLYIVTRSVSQGSRAGLVSVLGLSLGALVHVAAATAGLSALLAASAGAFDIIRLVGAAYLIYLGLRAWMSTPDASARGAQTARPLRRIFVDGVVVSLLNPKIAVFFIAFLPQFVDTGAPNASQQVLMLGLLYVAMALCTDSAYALTAARVGRWMDARFVTGPWPRYFSGGVYIGLGVTTALSGRRT